MSYDDDAVKAKLSQLNETQDSIMAVSQWIMFHRRHASRTAQIWARQVQTSFPPKRLCLIYLANDVIQQTKNRGKDDFYKAFSPVIADSFGEAYTSANSETRGKLRRVVDIWRQRNIFDPDVQNALERKVSDVDKGRGAKGKLGGSLFASGGTSDTGIPSELTELANLQTNLSKAAIASSSTTKTAAEEHSNLTSPDYVTPTPPVYANRLNQLLTSLSKAHSSLQTTLAARDALLAGLEKIVTENRVAREKEAMEIRDLEQKRPDIEDRKTKVEDAIMRGLSAEDAAAATAQLGANEGNDDDIPRPDFEELTPPPTERLSPPPAPIPSGAPEPMLSTNGDDGAHTPTEEVPPSVLMMQQATSSRDPRRRPQQQSSMISTTEEIVSAAVPGSKRPSEEGPVNGALVQDPRRKSFENHTFKRRKTEEQSLAGDGMEGLDDDVVGMLG